MSHFSTELAEAYIDYTQLLQSWCLISYLNLKQNLFYSILKTRNLNAVVSLCLYKNNSRDLTIDKVEFRLLFIDSKGNSYINE